MSKEFFTLPEITGPEVEFEKLTPKKQEQQKDLKARLEIIRGHYGKPMNRSSGVRTWKKHTDIYKDKAAKKQAPFLDGKYDESKVPKLSRHLETVEDAAAIDFADPKGELYKYLQDNPKVVEEANVYLELDTAGWVHIQNKAPGSGKRWFKA